MNVLRKRRERIQRRIANFKAKARQAYGPLSRWPAHIAARFDELRAAARNLRGKEHNHFPQAREIARG